MTEVRADGSGRWTARLNETGTERGRPGLVSSLGILSGLVAPVVLGVYLSWGAVVADDDRHDGYDWIVQPMSHLGDDDDVVGTWFSYVQLATVVLLVLFGLAVLHRIPRAKMVGRLTIATAVPTAALAVTRCLDGTQRLDSGEYETHCQGELVHNLHVIAAITIGVAILATPAWAAKDLPAEGSYRGFKTASGWAWRFAFAGGILHVVVWLTELQLVGVSERAFWLAGYGWMIVGSGFMIANWRADDRVPFSLDLVQAGALRAPRSWDAMGVVAIRFFDVHQFRSWLGWALSTGLVAPDRPDPARQQMVTVLLTSAGVRKLGFGVPRPHPVGVLDEADPTWPFFEGAKRRAADNGDVGDSAARHWPDEWKNADAVLWLRAPDRDGLRALRLEVGASLTPGLVATDLATCEAMRDDDGEIVEHFGFRDGLSRTWVEGLHDPHDEGLRGGGKYVDGRFEQLALGEFVLGEVDESGDAFPLPSPFFVHGTFVVFRKLEQDVERYEALVERVARRHPPPRAGADLEERADEAGAALVGRRRDGEPLATAPDDEPSQFAFGDDPEGDLCPMGAHVRRSNPRDALGFGGRPSHRRRILRRGMTYDEGGGRRGLLFVAVNARIGEQFEFIQRAWLNDGNAFRLGDAPDAIAGSWSGPRRLVVPGRPPTIHGIDRPLVTTRGALYAFAPSMAALGQLACDQRP